MFTTLKKVYIPNPSNTEHPEVKLELYYKSGQGYTITANSVKRENKAGYGTESFFPADGKRYNAGECKRRSKDRDTQAIILFDDIKERMTAQIEAASTKPAEA